MPNEPGIAQAQEQDKINADARKCRRGRGEDPEGREQTQTNFATQSLQSCSTKENMALFSVSVTALAGYVATTASGLNTVHSDYRNADKDSRHIQLQKEHLQINQGMLNNLLPKTPSTLHAIKSSLSDIESALPAQPCTGRKREKLRWAAYGGKRKAQQEIGKLKEVETSTTVTLLLTANNKLLVCII
jgi:hypothetical protein